jgi:hypothetical protein
LVSIIYAYCAECNKNVLYLHNVAGYMSSDLDLIGPPATNPRYRCHKIVSAWKILHVQIPMQPFFRAPVCRGSKSLGSACGVCEQCKWVEDVAARGCVLQLEGFQLAHVSVKWMEKNNPQAGGYFVRYEDGYESFSPAAAFESGYTRI